MQQSDYEIVGKFGFESRTHRLRKLWFYQESELFCIIFVSEIYFS